MANNLLYYVEISTTSLEGGENLFEVIKRSWFIIILAIIIIGFIIFTNLNEKLPSIPESSVSSPPVETAEENIQAAFVLVDVKGEVQQPGVYQVDQNARVHDVIELAGGFTKKANQLHVNLAQKVQDEMVIIIPNESSEESNTMGIANDKVRLNYASEAEIETINGIGPSKAQAIVKYREEHGLFKTIEDLLEISGIGEKTLENIRDQIQIP